jgi:hypothetical protein
VLIAEELILVALDPVKGTVPLGAKTYLNAGLAGALLAELAIAGNLGIKDGRIVPAGDPPTDPFLADVLAAIGSETTAERAKSAVKKLDRQVGGVWHRLVERMVAAGTLGEDKHGRLMPTRPPSSTDPARTRFWAVCERPPPATVRSRPGRPYFWRWRVPAGSSSGSPPIAPAAAAPKPGSRRPPKRRRSAPR